MLTGSTYLAAENEALKTDIERLNKVIETEALNYALQHDTIERLRKALFNVRGYIKDCDHEPALDEIDAVLNTIKQRGF